MPATNAVQVVGAGTGNAFYIFNPTDVRLYFSDPTLMRLLVNVSVLNQGVGHVSWGVIAWDDVNDTPDDIPNPFHQPNLDWIMTGNAGFHGIGSTVVSTGHGGGWVESQAKRRLGNQSGLLFSIINITTQPAEFTMAARYLIKE